MVKPPEFEKIATEPLISDLSGWSPPSAPPIRTRFQRVRHAEAVAADDVDAVRLRHRPDFAGVVHRDLLGDDDDLAKLRVDPDQFGHAVAHARGRQVDDAGVEAVPGVQPLADVVVDRNVARRVFSTCPARPGEVPNTTLPPEKAWLVGVTCRLSPPAMFSTQTRSSRRGDLRQRPDAEIVGNALDALMKHCLSPLMPLRP